MTSQEHYFNQASRSVEEYFPIRGTINGRPYTFSSAPGLFSAQKIDLGTRILLKHLHIPNTNLRILDLGCGIGVVGVYIAQWAQEHAIGQTIHLDACDSSQLAVDVTRHNLKTFVDNKQFTHRVLNSDILSDPYFLEVMYDIIITNPPFSAGKSVVTQFIQQSYDHLSAGGKLWMVVPTNKGAKSYISLTQSVFGSEQVRVVALEAGYRVWIATKDS